MSGKGACHFRLVPRSPWVPTTASQEVREGREGCRGVQMWWVRREAVATGGELLAVAWEEEAGKSEAEGAWWWSIIRETVVGSGIRGGLRRLPWSRTKM